MNWGFILERCDAARETSTNSAEKKMLNDYRVKLRVLHGKEWDKDVPEEDEMLAQARELFDLTPPPPEPEPAAVTPEMETAAWEVPEGWKTVELDASPGAKMHIGPRAPFVPQKPDLEDADENTVEED